MKDALVSSPLMVHGEQDATESFELGLNLGGAVPESRPRKWLLSVLRPRSWFRKGTPSTRIGARSLGEEITDFLKALGSE